MRPSCSKVVGLFAVCCGAVLLLASGGSVDVAAAQGQPAERDATTERVERAEQDYHQTCEAARDRLIDALNEAVIRAADKGDLEELETLEAQRDAFEERGELPPARAVRRDALAYHRALERAADELGRVYERAIREYTRERRIDEARAMRTRLGLLEAGAHIEIVEFEGHRYGFIAQNKTWHEARDICIELGGHLVAIESAAEDAFVHRLVGERRHAWLGASDEADEGAWTWVTGEAVVYSNWDPGEPNGGRACNWMMMYPHGTWDDLRAQWNGMAGFVCEWPGEPSGDDAEH